jgi:hypothetical protein
VLVIPVTVGSENWRITVQVSLGKKLYPASKISRAKRAKGVEGLVKVPA